MAYILNHLKKALLASVQEAMDQKVSLSLSVASASLLSVALEAQNYLVQYTPSNPEIWLVRLFAVLVAVVLLWIATYFWFKPKLVVSQDDGGCWLDKKTGIRYCTSCKTTHNKLVPLAQGADRWRCKVKDCWACYHVKQIPSSDENNTNRESPRFYG